MNRFAPVRRFWPIVPLFLSLLWLPQTQATIHFGEIVVTNIGHTFQRSTNGEVSVRDWLIDQRQFSDATARLRPLTTNLTSEDTFAVKVSAPPGMKFWLHPPRDGFVIFQGGLSWQFNLPTYGNTIYGGSIDMVFDNLVGIPTGNQTGVFHDPTTARMGFGIFAPTWTEFTFTSINFTAKVFESLLNAGPDPVTFLPRNESALSIDVYSNTDVGPSISLIPIEQPVNAMVSFSQALDTEGTPFVWSTIGDDRLPWNGRLFGSRDGTDVAESGPLTNGTAATLQTKVVGPGKLIWWWKVSSEANHDYLKLFVDGVQQTRISGNVDWEQRGLNLGYGLHVLKWTYAKDGEGSAGADKGWVDEVRFVPDTNCLFNLSVAGRAHDGGAATGLVGVATGPNCLWGVVCTNTWIVALTPVHNHGSGTVTYALMPNYTTTPRTGSVSIAGHSFVVTQSGGSSFEFNNSLQEALDVYEVDYWVDHGERLINQGLVTHDGVDAVQFGPLLDGRTVSIHAGFIGPGTVSFWWKVSSETNLDNFKFSGPQGEERLSGETDWRYRSYRITGSLFQCYWVYSTDETFAGGNNRGWLDQLTFIPDVQGSVAISPDHRDHGFGSEIGSINVTLNSGTWRAWTTSEWIHVSAPLNTTMNGRVDYTVSANTTGHDRLGYVQVADQVFSIRQSNGDTPLSLRLVSYTRTNGALLQLQGPRFETSIIQISSNLVQWSPISTNQMSVVPCPTCPYVQILDYSATNVARRFYRALQK